MDRQPAGEEKSREQVEAELHDEPEFADEHTSVTSESEPEETESESPDQLGGMDM